MGRKAAIMIATAIVLATHPGEAQEVKHGQAEYLDSCAVCHGPDGKGNGPMAEELITRPADLTVLSQKNKGAFPYNRVFAMIDGRYIVPGHGPREMPVWGRQFLAEDVKVFGQSGGEIVTTERIHELAGYLESLQR
jgi:mono/diheme cytochrome c family protein